MHRNVLLAFIAIGIGIAPTCAAEPVKQTWTVEGVTREGLVSAPATAKTIAAPVVFAFHGHGGTAAHAARTFAYHTHWPEAVVVYPQGLPTPGKLTDPEGKKTGWQSGLREQNDRDLKFFDAVLASLKADDKIDDKRIYCTGHSNGGSFTYLLWAARGDTFAAFAPSAAIAGKMQGDLKPKPVLHVAGEKDPLVKFDWQTRTIDALKKLNGCEADGTPWGPKVCKRYESKTGTPVVAYIHDGDHTFPAKEAPPTIVKFFKEQSKK